MTGDELRQLAARVAHDMHVAEVRDTIPGALLEAAAALDAARESLPAGYVLVDGWYERESDGWEIEVRTAYPDGVDNPPKCVAYSDEFGDVEGDTFADAIAAAEAAKGSDNDEAQCTGE